MKRSFKVFLLFFISVLFFQCQKEISYVGGPDNQPTLPNPITATLQGNVIDETGQPAAGVSVQVGAKTATTDAKGYFRITAAALDKNTALVTAQKNGYFKAYRSFSATAGTNQVRIKLVKRDLAGTVDGTAGGEATLANGSKVALPGGGVVVASSGAAYAGAVKVYAAYIDPSASDIGETVPGNFTANDKDGKRVTLTSYGMLAVELEGAGGEKLQIKSGAEATLTTAIPASTLGAAPATIPMWYVDEATGVWKEEGSATKSGNSYVGKVKHFSFWNCDVSQNAVILTVTLKNSEGYPLVHAKVRIKRTTSSWAVYGYTDSLGVVSGYVPNGEALTLDVLNQCDASIYNQALAAMSQNTVLAPITIGSTATAIVTIKGKLLNCTNAAVTNGFALINYGAQTYHAGVNAAGEFSIAIVTCTNTIANTNITGIDNAAQQQSSPVTVPITTPITNAGNISVCGTSSAQFINYTLDGTAYSITSTNPNDSLTGYTLDSVANAQKRTFLNGMTMGTTNKLNLRFNHTAFVSGTYPASELIVNGFTQTTLTQPFNVIVTAMPTAIGQYYEGSFSGSFTSGGNHTISGTFRIRRLQ
ncbi:MAG: carboxypeptidase regulatory-like protein [Flaviaesturariibacter sp.]|nr:carboxypeptidase regulatory-like protein [Flaviaesturariibacter sp.]